MIPPDPGWLPHLPEHAAIITLGALAGGFVSGLAGFGTGLATAGIWLHVLEPAAATTLTLICSVTAQILTLPAIWRDIQPRRVLPFVLPGLLGVPVGLGALAVVDPAAFKLGIGLLLIAFPTFMLLCHRLWGTGTGWIWGGRRADAAIGLLGGILGGLAGLSGPAPTVWATLRGWSKDDKRSVFQTYNLSVLSAALVAHGAAGHVTRAMLVPIALALPGTLVGTLCGVRLYHRLNDRNFNDLVMALLLASGVTLLVSLL